MKRLRRNLKKYKYLDKNVSRISLHLKNIAIRARILGARDIGFDEFENGLLILNRASLLGDKGDLVTTPLDRTIFKFVADHGEWEPEESRFLAKLLVDSEVNGQNKFSVALIDIGANSGLVTKQVLRLSGSGCSLVLVEPIPNHVKAIQANLMNLPKKNNLKIVEAALDETTGERKILIQDSNRGNSSFLSSAVPNLESKELNVKVLAVEDFVSRYLNGFERFIIKSDTQGFDSRILSLLPKEVWQKCEGAVVEVWALPEIETKHVENLIKMWAHFSVFDWEADGSAPTNLREISSFWLSKSGRSRNLFIRGNIRSR
jgi:FkbM family methyltransferase